MATQLAQTENKTPAKVQVATGGKLAAFVPQTMEEAWRLSGALAASGMTPKAYGNDQNKIMVGIMAGAEVGLTPFAALQSIAVIGNNPSLWGDGALALVQASGLLDDMEETDDGNAATCRLNRKGRETPIIRRFSMEDAKKAALSGKTGPWSQYPARMRQMRARAFALRDGFADVLKGLHIAEEVRDYNSTQGGEVMEAQPLTATMLIEQARGISEIIEPETGEIIQSEPEGRTDEQHGDQFDGNVWDNAVAEIRDLIVCAVDRPTFDEANAAFIRHAGALPEDIQRELNGLLTAKRKDLQKAETPT